MCYLFKVEIDIVVPLENTQLFHPNLAPSAIDFLHWRMYRCTRRKTDFPPQQTGAATLAPGEACRWKAEACSSAIEIGAILVI